MIRELLEQREREYKSKTDEILGLYGDKIHKALEYYLKTDRTIRIASLDIYPKNKHFVLVKFVTELKLGDKVQASNGTKYEITEQNIHLFVKEALSVILPAKLVNEATAVQIYERIKYFDEFVRKYGAEKFNLCISSGIEDFTDLVEKEQHQDLLEKITDPTDDIIKTFDDLQKVQYVLLSKNEKVVH